MHESLEQFDTQLFFAINGRHNAFFDCFFYWVSNAYVWIPLYALLFYLLVKIYGLRTAFFVLLAAGLAVGLSDTISSALIKNSVARYRPTHHLLHGELVHTVNGYRGGQYGFVSSHAANFGAWTTVLFFAFFRQRWRKTAFALLCLPVLVGYSRIYLGVHYPADVFCGWLLGIGLGGLLWLLLRRLVARF